MNNSKDVNTTFNTMQTSHELGSITSNIEDTTTSSADIDSNWATSVSQYLLARRQQTYQAYQSQLQVNNAENEDVALADDDWLFKSLLELLVQRLEEGHTVVTLSSTGHLDRTWQWQLVQPLFQPLLDYATSILAQNIDIQTLIDNKHTLWKTVMLQSTLSQFEQQRFAQRFDAATKLYNYIQSLNNDDKENSLSKLIHKLSQKKLITNNKKENRASPIIFETTFEESSLQKSSGTTLTLWLHRTWQAEYNLAYHILRIKNQTVQALPIAANSQLNPEQQEAIYMANRSAFSIITGGPGTGKTYTVAQLVIALQQAQNGVVDQPHTGINLALAAPTGKAAQRMQESLQDAIESAGVNIQLPEAKTIHRLLGIGQGGQPRYHTDNPLSEDIIIVDEASMLGVELANYLVSAVKPSARLILLGDANQLAAVDAGAVLADLCRIPALQRVSQRLESSRRFTADSGIGKLARLINDKDTYAKSNMNTVWQLMHENESLGFYHLTQPRANQSDSVGIEKVQITNSLSKTELCKGLYNFYKTYVSQTYNNLAKVKRAKSMPISEHIDSFSKLMSTLNQFRVLTAGHHGRCGDHAINQYMSEQHRQQLKLPLSKSPWYHGRPIMVLQNNYELGLFNGDIGICMQTDQGRLQVFFENKKQGISVNMLGDDMVATSYAMTIHKSQGSEFEHVAICFDDSNARLLSQELIYTAVTRAKKQVSIFSTETAFTRALATPTIRQTGLSLQFKAMGQANE
ncbi:MULTISPECIES: exodeoxyribonuclease V subunit alpha [unclassified Psychrobacter]|uniref:exodeoxyribonuclease V subunit alpha n=1 Tax=unclassified Psychrobacter TaxID=196806 RepID=UPI003FD40231